MAQLIQLNKKESIKTIIDKNFTSISKKVDDIELKLKLMASEIQIDKILQRYDELSKNEMNIEQKVMFSNYLMTLFENANSILENMLRVKYEYSKKHNISYTINLYDTFNMNIDKVISTLELMKSDDIHDRVIGIDNFMSLAHTNSTLLPEIISLVNGVTVLHEEDDEKVDYYFDWRTKVDRNIVKILNEIHNRKGLTRFRYEDM